MKPSEDSRRDLQDNIKQANIFIMRVPGEERDKEIESLFEEIMAENFPNLMKEINIQAQKVQSPKQDKPTQA